MSNPGMMKWAKTPLDKVHPGDVIFSSSTGNSSNLKWRVRIIQQRMDAPREIIEVYGNPCWQIVAEAADDPRVVETFYYPAVRGVPVLLPELFWED